MLNSEATSRRGISPKGKTLVPINELDKQVEAGKVAWSGQASALAPAGCEMCWLHLSRACVPAQPYVFSAFFSHVTQGEL